jgi:hypothetical protein
MYLFTEALEVLDSRVLYMDTVIEPVTDNLNVEHCQMV